MCYVHESKRGREVGGKKEGGRRDNEKDEEKKRKGEGRGKDNIYVYMYMWYMYNIYHLLCILNIFAIFTNKKKILKSRSFIVFEEYIIKIFLLYTETKGDFKSNLIFIN